MNWNEVRSPIKISTSDIKSLTHEISKKKEWANLREKTIKKQIGIFILNSFIFSPPHKKLKY